MIAGLQFHKTPEKLEKLTLEQLGIQKEIKIRGEGYPKKSIVYTLTPPEKRLSDNKECEEYFTTAIDALVIDFSQYEYPDGLSVFPLPNLKVRLDDKESYQKYVDSYCSQRISEISARIRPPNEVDSRRHKVYPVFSIGGLGAGLLAYIFTGEYHIELSQKLTESISNYQPLLSPIGSVFTAASFVVYPFLGLLGGSHVGSKVSLGIYNRNMWRSRFKDLYTKLDEAFREDILEKSSEVSLEEKAL